MRKYASALLSVLVLLACGLGDLPARAAKPKIGFILSTMQEERYQRDRKYFEDAVKKLGGEVIFASCNNSEQTQAAEVDNMLAQGVNALVIQPVNDETASSFAKQAKSDGVPIVSYDRLIMNAPLDAYVTEDSFHVGAAQAEAAVKFTHGKGNYVLLLGTAGQSGTIARTEGVLSVLKKYPGVKIVVQQNHAGWSPELAMKTTENALTQYRNDIQAVIANNSGMANGAVQALQEQKLTGKVFVAGADADLTAVRNIVQGKQQVDVMISIEDQAKRAAEIAMALAEKKDFKTDSLTDNGAMKVRTANTPIRAVDRSNVDELVIKPGFHPRNAVYSK